MLLDQLPVGDELTLFLLPFLFLLLPELYSFQSPCPLLNILLFLPVETAWNVDSSLLNSLLINSYLYLSLQWLGFLWLIRKNTQTFHSIIFFELPCIYCSSNGHFQESLLFAFFPGFSASTNVGFCSENPVLIKCIGRCILLSIQKT